MGKVNGKVLGLDNGFRFTKTSNGVCVESTLKKGVDVYNDDTLQIIMEAKDFIVGEPNGLYISDADKLKTDENRLNVKACTLTSIGLSYPTESFIDVNVVVGVPVAYYQKQKEEFRQMILGASDKIYINKVGFEQNILIKNVLVYPQSAGLIFQKAQESSKIKGETSLVIDVGGGTWDVSLFDGLKFVDGQTYKKGMLILHGKVAQYINSNYYTSYDKSDIYKLLQRGYFTAGSERVSTDVTKEVIAGFIAQVADTIKNQFNPDTIDNVFLIGGGAEEVLPYLEQHIDNILIQENPRFVNANCFELMGKMKWSR